MMQRYYFFFSNSRTSWFSRIFKDGFQHVEMVCEMGPNLMHLNPRWGRVDIGITSEYTLAEVIAKFKDMDHTIVMLRSPAPDPQARIMRGPAITCATYLAYTFGISFAGATPYQFYKTLKARGGIDV